MRFRRRGWRTRLRGARAMHPPNPPARGGAAESTDRAPNVTHVRFHFRFPFSGNPAPKRCCLCPNAAPQLFFPTFTEPSVGSLSFIKASVGCLLFTEASVGSLSFTEPSVGSMSKSQRFCRDLQTHSTLHRFYRAA